MQALKPKKEKGTVEAVPFLVGKRKKLEEKKDEICTFVEGGLSFFAVYDYILLEVWGVIVYNESNSEK